MIINIIGQITARSLILPGSSGMFVSSADFLRVLAQTPNTTMTFYGQEKLEYNAKLCIMNMAVHGLNARSFPAMKQTAFIRMHTQPRGML